MDSSWLDMVQQALLEQGFVDPGPLQQVMKPGQTFGLVKRLDDVWEMHVRGFENQTLEAEIEISRDYFEHWNDRFRRDATPELMRILDTSGVPYSVRGDLPHATVTFEAPESVTPWRPLAVLVGILALLWFFGRED